MKSGIYAIASLDGAPPDERDLAVLGLSTHPDAPGLALEVVDSGFGGSAVTVARAGSILLAFLGHLDEPAELAASLGRSAAETPAALALAAIRRWGPEAVVVRMPGEWSLLRWDGERRELMLGVSGALRDVVCFATDGRRVAVAPSIRLLGVLPWVGTEIDPIGFSLRLARWPLRRSFLGDRTVARQVKTLEPGTMRIFTEEAQTRITRQPPAMPQPLWKGNFEDGVAELERTARRIMRQTLARHGTVAMMLSGGLDSSLLTWLAAEERRPGQSVFCLTSAAPEGSGLADERDFARQVADTVGLPINLVTPAVDCSAYRPRPRMFEMTEGPTQSSRHYLYDTLYGAALAGGADALIDGVMGENSLTRTAISSRKAWLREWIWFAKAEAGERLAGGGWPATGFHARLSRGALARLPRDIAARRPPLDMPDFLRRTDPLGFAPDHEMIDVAASATPFAGLRHLLPYRDRRLLRTAAIMPAGFTCRDGLGRAIARAMLKDRLPDSIRLRTRPMPFSPDYGKRLRRDAAGAAQRMDLFREAGADEWLDLDWLAQKLVETSQGDAVTATERLQVQVTAIAAEFFVWWRSPAR
ncbi:MAG: asparagine synthase-related protein [Rhizomicrobium sp.]